MSREENHEAVAEAVVESEQVETKPARRALLAALFGAASMGAVGLTLASGRPKIGPDAKPEVPLDLARPGVASSVASGTVVAWVTSIGTVPDATDTNLRALHPADDSVRMLAVALGFHTEGDGGGGVFEWDPSGGSDDGGTVIVYNVNAPTVANQTPGTGKCWRRIYSGPIDVRWFGAKCNAYDTSPTDDTDAFWRALSALRSGVQLVISGPMAVGATNGWTTPLHVSNKSDFSIVGLGANCGLRLMHYPGAQVGFPGIGPGQSFVISGCSRVQIRGVLFDGNGLNGALLGLAQVTDSLVADCVFVGAKAATNPALFTIACTGNVYRGNKFDDNDTGATIGFPSAYGGGGATLIEQNAVFTENSITNCTYASGGAALWLCARESSITNNVFTDNVGGTINIFASGSYVPSHVVISGNMVVGGGGHGIRSDYSSITSYVSDIVISDNVFEENYGYAVYLYQTSRVTITGNTIRNNGGAVATNNGATNWLIANNSMVDTRETPIQGGISLNPIVGCVIANNIIDGVGGSYAGSLYPTAIYLNGQNDFPVQDVNVAGNVIRNSNRGLYAIGQRISVTGNSILDMLDNAYGSGLCIYLVGDSVSGGSGHLCANVTITGNQLSTSSTGCSVAIDTARNVRLADNQFLGTAGYDVYHLAPSGEVLYSNGDEFVNTVYTSSYIVEIHGKQKQMRAAAVPTSTTVSWSVGDVVYKDAPASGGYIGWVCTAAGSPGTWKQFGLIT